MRFNIVFAKLNQMIHDPFIIETIVLLKISSTKVSISIQSKISLNKCIIYNKYRGIV